MVRQHPHRRHAEIRRTGRRDDHTAGCRGPHQQRRLVQEYRYPDRPAEQPTYEYAVSADKDEAHYGETKTYTTQTFGKDEPYTFLVFGDPQIGCSGSIDDDNGGWTNTLNHALAKAPNANFLFSMGDQINAYYKYDTSNLSQVEEEYDGFLNAPQLTQLPLATELGNHDCGYNTALYGQHFTLPNISEKYGQVSGDAYGDNAVDSESTGDGDYYFTYNNTLYMVLNTSCLSIAEHKAFLEETIQANPDVTWKVVSFHKSIYSVASHVTESDIVTLRNGLSPILSQLGIDIVLQGHDHVYARSYIMGGESGMTADVQKNADGSALTEVTNPDGVQYITITLLPAASSIRSPRKPLNTLLCRTRRRFPTTLLPMLPRMPLP